MHKDCHTQDDVEGQFKKKRVRKRSYEDCVDFCRDTGTFVESDLILLVVDHK